ncbi:MAG: GNAT family N-acetyltransferase [Betaproteobacteria bacterium]|nr:GNAT family N-acetyltransferase [Betaproteobacteria bacterium]
MNAFVASQDHAELLELERLTLATSPALREELYDEWVLRASGTDTRRANSVTQLGRGTLPLAEKIDCCERWYADAGQPATFRLTSALSPPELDALLEARGYSVVTPSHMMCCALDQVSEAEPPPQIVERTARQGIADLHRLKGSAPALIERDQTRQARWTSPERHLAFMEAGEVRACGLVRVEGPWAGLFNMRTAAAHRGRGIASALVAALLAWAHGQGARQAFLQVERGNDAAVRLYRRAGFDPRYDYHYRVKP